MSSTVDAETQFLVDAARKRYKETVKAFDKVNEEAKSQYNNSDKEEEYGAWCSENFPKRTEVQQTMHESSQEFIKVCQDAFGKQDAEHELSELRQKEGEVRFEDNSKLEEKEEGKGE